MASYDEVVAAAKQRITEISVEELAAAPDAWRLVDVRERSELVQGSLAGSTLIPRGVLESDIAAAVPDTSTPIALVCAVGARSALAAETLERLGYTDVVSLAGGIAAWKAAGHPIDIDSSLTEEQRTRYARHLTLAEVGEEGQRKLLDSRVLVLGAGGLGSPAAMYLAAAGVGTLGIVDDDSVELSNLQRQLLHGTDRIGVAKTESARRRLNDLNPGVDVITHDVRLDAGNALDVLKGYDVIVDGADNFPTRYLVNDASLHLRTPVVHGSIFRFEGQAAVFAPYEGPCYRCLFRLPPPPELAPNCAVAGVLGVLPGIIGSLQAMETIKLILGLGELLVGKLLTYDSLDQSFTTLNLPRDPGCPACSDEANPPPLVDYDEACRPVSR
jgi:molybdopterin/thiamine biosynthesis adenylyltransferase/rhodanese-related sulfurtransferase